MVLYKKNVFGLEIGVDQIQIVQDCTQGLEAEGQGEVLIGTSLQATLVKSWRANC